MSVVPSEYTQPSRRPEKAGFPGALAPARSRTKINIENPGALRFSICKARARRRDGWSHQKAPENYVRHTADRSRDFPEPPPPKKISGVPGDPPVSFRGNSSGPRRRGVRPSTSYASWRGCACCAETPPRTCASAKKASPSAAAALLFMSRSYWALISSTSFSLFFFSLPRRRRRSPQSGTSSCLLGDALWGIPGGQYAMKREKEQGPERSLQESPLS